MIGHTLVGNGAKRVIVLHGWLGDSSVFDPMLPSLDTEQFTYAFIDYRGYGRSRETTGEFSLAEIADDAIALADALGWRDFALLGHSMGGAAALRTALKVPDRVTQIIAATPVPASGVSFVPGEQKLFESARDNQEARQAIIDFTTGSRHCGAWSRWMSQRSTETSDPRAFGAYFQAWSTAAFADAARGLPHPILVVVGEHDKAVTAKAMEATYLADYPAARLKVLKEAGHYPMQETPVGFASAVQEFLLDETAGRSAAPIMAVGFARP